MKNLPLFSLLLILALTACENSPKSLADNDNIAKEELNKNNAIEGEQLKLPKAHETLFSNLPSGAEIVLNYRLVSSSNKIFRAEITLTNNSAVAVSDWYLDFKLGSIINSVTDGRISFDNNIYTYKPDNKNQLIQANSQVSFAFVADLTNKDTKISDEKFVDLTKSLPEILAIFKYEALRFSACGANFGEDRGVLRKNKANGWGYLVDQLVN